MKIIRDYNLHIFHFDGDQTEQELFSPCNECLMKKPEGLTDESYCDLYNLPIKECERRCISNYRIDHETLVDAMRRKMGLDNEEFSRWINSFPEFINSEDGKLYVVKTSDDILQVAKDLERSE